MRIIFVYLIVLWCENAYDTPLKRLALSILKKLQTWLQLVKGQYDSSTDWDNAAQICRTFIVALSFSSELNRYFHIRRL